MMECTYLPLVVVSFFIATLAEIAFAAIGFGPAVLFEICWQLCAVVGIGNGDLTAAVTNIVVMEFVTGIVQLFWLRKHFNLRLVLLFNVSLAATLPFGTLALEKYGHQPWLKVALGFVFMLIVGLQLWKRKRDSAGERSLPNLDDPTTLGAVAILVAEGISGFSRGLIGVAGPPVMVLLMFFTIDRQTWRFISASNRCVQVCVQGAILTAHSELSLECWPQYLALITGGLTGIRIGNMLAPRVDAAAFQTWLIIFLVTGSLLMVTSWSRTLSVFSAFVILGTILGAIAWSIMRKSRSQGRTNEELTVSFDAETSHSGIDLEKHVDDTPCGMVLQVPRNLNSEEA